MLDDLQYADDEYEREMRKASNLLALCIARARQGLPTKSPEGLKWKIKPGGVQRPWADWEYDALLSARADGLTYQDIAEELGRTHDAVKKMARKLQSPDDPPKATGLLCSTC